MLSKAGLGSRTEARSWIHAGRVTVNGRPTQNPDQWIDLQHDKILFDGMPLRKSAPLSILLYKPTGYLTTLRDPEGRPTVYDLLPDVGSFIAPAGRLDMDTSGLLILTNDTQFAERLTNPDHHVPRTYLMECSTLVSEEDLRRLRNGVELSDGPTRPAIVRRERDAEKHSHIEMTLTEGRNRQVRRMMEAIGSKVLKLTRVSIGPIAIGDLMVGKWRELTAGEIAALGNRKSALSQRD